jgi:ribonuclease P protein component
VNNVKKINILKENKDFSRIIKQQKPFKYKGYIVYLEINIQENYKFGISVSKKITNAVGRNKIKRQVREILSKNIYEKNFNCIIIIRKSYLENNFENNKQDLLFILKKLNVIKED